MIQKKAMGSFSCSLMNMEVRENTLGKMFLVIDWYRPGVVVFQFAFVCGLPLGID